jgi:hypothetical protein
MIVRVCTAFILLLVLLYGIREALPLILGPRIELTSPKNGESFYNGFITISGTAVHTQSVRLDGGPLLTDQHGNFTTTLTLPHGGAILTISATDRFGRTVSEERTVFVP